MKKIIKITTGLIASSLLLTSCGIFTSGSKSFTVTWKNFDGTVLEVDEKVAKNSDPTYDGPTPVKEGTAQYTFVFAGWSPSLSPVTANVEYVATYKEEVNKYTITWKNADGTTLKVDENLPYGSTPSYQGETPKKDSTVSTNYVFDGWTPEVSAVTGDAEYTAKFKEEARKYHIVWKNTNGAILKMEDVAYGTTPSYSGETPTKEKDAQYTYVFTGWSPEVSTVTGDAEYTATYRHETNKYTITWVNYDGTVLKVDEDVPYGTNPAYSGDTPTRATKRGATFTFSGWSPSVGMVMGNQTYTAQYDAEATFLFDKINYQMQDGYTLADIEGSPWIDSNIAGELEKIKKPSLKDDFYAAINYENILNRVPKSFDLCNQIVSQAFGEIYSDDVNTTNGKFFNTVFDKIADGDTTAVGNYLAGINLNTYLSSKEIFASTSSYLDLSPMDNGYLVSYNDGYMTGSSLSIQTLLFLSSYDGYESLVEPTNNIVNYLASSFNYSISESALSDLRNLETNLTYATYSDMYRGTTGTTSYTVNTLPWSQMKAALLDLGLSNSETIVIRNVNKNSFNYLFNSYASSFPDAVKNSILTRLGFDNRYYMGLNGYRTINRNLTSTGYFREENNLYRYDDYRLSEQLVKMAMPILIEQSYIQLTGSETIKANVARLIEDVLTGYKEMMAENNWLGSATKQGIATKLNKMRFASCYSDSYKNFPKLKDDDLDSASLYTLVKRYQDTLLSTIADKTVDTTGYWGSSGMPSYTVNAFYSPASNSFVILNGLVSGCYSDEHIEETYGILGTVIGHEITHAFDSSGSQYDEDGNYRDWWGARDKNKFTTRVNKLIEFFNKITYYQDKKVDGDNVDGEATADMGGVKVMLHLAKKVENFDYDLFFRSYAELWCRTPYHYSQIEARAADSHPINYLRTNVTLAQFDEFVETYHIEPGDGMYIPENERVKIW